MTNVYSGKAVDVDRVLLVRYPQRLNLRALAKEANVSLGQAFNVSKALIRERMAIRESNDNELKLMTPHDLLTRLATVNNFLSGNEFVEYYTTDEDLLRVLKKFKDVENIDYALTGLAGAMKVAPYVRPSNVHVYVQSEGDAKNIAERIGLVPIENNGNVKFAIPKSTGVFYGMQKVDGINVVSNVQLYIDLYNYPARGREAAEEILKLMVNKWNEAGAV